MELTKDEQKLFFALCKYIRHLQNYNRIKKITDGVLLNSIELMNAFPTRVIQRYALYPGDVKKLMPWLIHCKKKDM